MIARPACKSITRLISSALLSGGLILSATAAMAALKVGDKAPDFVSEASLAGKAFSFSLKDALARGPVVLYFFPAAFTPGCTIEAHEFAEASDEFQKYGATVVGVSADDIEKLNKFSVSECRNKFAVASDEDQKVIKAYDAVLFRKPAYADRISYVISPEGKVIFVHSGMDPRPHVEKTMEAVRAWSSAHPGKNAPGGKKAR